MKVFRAATKRMLRKPGLRKFKSSKDYWHLRYVAGGNSGAGSYGHLAQFKAEVVNRFVSSHAIADLIEFGCGDGNQLRYAKYDKYVGYDVSSEAVRICRERFAGDTSKSFFVLDEYDGQQAELTISLDVIFHLVEDSVFDDYMTRLYFAARRYVIVYSSNYNCISDVLIPHVRHRKFTDWTARHQPDWSLIKAVPNRYPYDGDHLSTSFADFYIYGRCQPDRK